MRTFFPYKLPLSTNIFYLTGSDNNLKTGFFGSGHHFMNTLGYVIDVSSSQTAHVDASSFQQVDVMIRNHLFNRERYNNEKSLR